MICFDTKHVVASTLNVLAAVCSTKTSKLIIHETTIMHEKESYMYRR